jgi:N-acetylglucosaminyldiphosphoundecaprenol N-acetyl-beta-D-mannosaminyltransferase
VLSTDADLHAQLERGGPRRLVTVNLFDLSQYVRDASYRNLVDQADHWTADGQPVVRAFQRVGVAATRVTGSDLCRDLLVLPRSAGLHRVAVLGSSPEVLAAYGAALAAAGRELVFSDAGQRSTWTGDRLASALARAAPDVLLIAVGTPFGAPVAARLLPHVSCPIVPVGAGVGMAVGVERRAPRLAQRLNGEWAWRLITDPRRLARRYLVDCLPVLPALVLAARTTPPPTAAA